jgi:hypothetical protein
LACPFCVKLRNTQHYYRIDANADPSRISTTIAPKFCVGAQSAIAIPYVEPAALGGSLAWATSRSWQFRAANLIGRGFGASEQREHA